MQRFWLLRLTQPPVFQGMNFPSARVLEGHRDIAAAAAPSSEVCALHRGEAAPREVPASLTPRRRAEVCTARINQIDWIITSQIKAV